MLLLLLLLTTTSLSPGLKLGATCDGFQRHCDGLI
jgi:hypothetical protein